jgi:hypothetical protein
MPPRRPQPAIRKNDRDCLDLRLDEALEETFPASDPVAITPPRSKTTGKNAR